MKMLSRFAAKFTSLIVAVLSCFDRVMGYIDAANREGARLLTGGGRPSDPALAKGL